MSDARFSKAFVAPTKCLRTIDDVLDELTCIKRVFQDQLQVWKKVHSGDKSCLICTGCINNHGDEDEDESKDEEGGGICPSNILPEQSLELALRLEEDALKVRESASIYQMEVRPTEYNAKCLAGYHTAHFAPRRGEYREFSQSKRTIQDFGRIHSGHGDFRKKMSSSDVSSPSKRFADKKGSSVVVNQPLRPRGKRVPLHLDHERYWTWIMYV